VEQTTGEQKIMSLSKKQRLLVFNKSGGKCWYCGCNLPEKGWHADHIEPVYRGFDMVKNERNNKSSHVARFNGDMQRPQNDKIENIAPACAACNLFKSTFSIEGLRDELNEQVERGLKYNCNFRMAVKYGLVEITNKPVLFWFEENNMTANKQ
jgi:hypothetical protein